MMAKTKPFASRTDRLHSMNAALDRELGRLSQQVGSSQSALLTEMVQYHLGLRKSGDRPGKRLRANLALLTCEAFGRRYADAVWAAVAVELVHNFSLVFDDVQDHDELRRGRPSVWKVWGTGQAINAGAALEALVTRAVVELLPARYDQVVAVLGGHGEFVERAADLAGAIERSLASGKPACVNVMIESIAAPVIRRPG